MTPRAPQLAARLVFAACFLVALAMLAPSPYWLDSAEFAEAAFELGVAHPPGHPLVSLVGKLFALLPLGSVAFRVGLASAVLSALAAALTAMLGALVARRTGEALGGRDAVLEAATGVAAGLVFGLGHAAMLQAVRPEVYALNAALLVGACGLLVRWDGSPRNPLPLLLAALLLGLALANHHLLALLLCVAALLFLGAHAARHIAAQHDWGRRLRLVGLVVLAGTVGLLLYAYLPLRALRHPLANWGSPSTIARFFWTVSAKAFQKSLGRAGQGAVGGDGVGVALGVELGPWAPIAVVGAYVLLRLRATRATGVLLVAGAALIALAPALVGFDSANPDAYGYLEPAVALLAAAGCAAPVALVLLLPRARRIAHATCVLVGMSALVLGRPGAAVRSLARFGDADTYTRTLLGDAPSRALLVTSYFQSSFTVWYARSVEGMRLDVDYVHRHFLAYPGYREDLVLRRPSLAPLLGERDMDWSALASSRRLALVEYDLDLPDAVTATLAPGVGATEWRTDPSTGKARTIDLAVQEMAARALSARFDLDEPQSRRLLYWLDFVDAHRACTQAHADEAAAAVERARSLLGGRVDPDLDALVAACGVGDGTGTAGAHRTR